MFFARETAFTLGTVVNLGLQSVANDRHPTKDRHATKADGGSGVVLTTPAGS
jgi:hypothetical protein